MQIQLVMNNIEMKGEHSSSLVCLKSFSSWIVDFYFTKIYSNQLSTQSNNIIGWHDMFIIYQRLQVSSSSSSMIDFLELCKNKLKQIKKDLVLEEYQKYLNRCGLYDVIDLFHQCQFESFEKPFILSMNSIENDVDQLLFEYLLELPLVSWCIYDVKTKLKITETKEYLLTLINTKNRSHEQANNKNLIKHTLCMYLSLLLDMRNEHALIQCLTTFSRIDFEREILIELQQLSKYSKNECLTLYEILLSFLRRKESVSNQRSQSLQQNIASNDDNHLFHVLNKYYIGIQEFVAFIKQVKMKIDENEQSKIESIITFRQVLQLISKQIRTDTLFNRDDFIIKEVIGELCECFQATLPLMNWTLPIRFTSSQSTLVGHQFLPSVAHLCAQETIDLPVNFANGDRFHGSSFLQSPLSPIHLETDSTTITTEVSLEEKVADQLVKSVFVRQVITKEEASTNENHCRRYESRQCLDLSIILETSFENESMIHHQTGHVEISTVKTQFQPIVKRQPLREIDINSFNNQERQPDNEKTRSQNPIVFTLVSDGDKENLPVTSKKRSMIATKNEPPNKKQKKTNLTESEDE